MRKLIFLMAAIAVFFGSASAQSLFDPTAKKNNIEASRIKKIDKKADRVALVDTCCVADSAYVVAQPKAKAVRPLRARVGERKVLCDSVCEKPVRKLNRGAECTEQNCDSCSKAEKQCTKAEKQECCKEQKKCTKAEQKK